MPTFQAYRYTGNVSEHQVITITPDSRSPSRLHIYPSESVAFYEGERIPKSDQSEFDLQSLVPVRQSMIDFVRAANEIQSVEVVEATGTVKEMSESEFRDQADLNTMIHRADLVFDSVFVEYDPHELHIEGSNVLSVLDVFAEKIEL